MPHNENIISVENILLADYNRIKTENSGKGKSILISHIGNITQETTVTISYFVENQLELRGTRQSLIKKTGNITIETLQNTMFHAEKNAGGFHLAYFIIAHNSNNEEYKIYSCNHVKNKDIAAIKIKIDEIKNSTIKELNDKYTEIQKKGEFTKTGGAGLGLLIVAIACNNRLDFHVTKTNDEYSLFCLNTTLN